MPSYNGYGEQFINLDEATIIGPRREETCIRGLQPGFTTDTQS